MWAKRQDRTKCHVTVTVQKRDKLVWVVTSFPRLIAVVCELHVS